MSSEKTLIIGGTGKVGSELTALLGAAGVPLRMLVRGELRVAPALAGPVSCVRGDLADAASLRSALDGIEQVFLVSRDQPRQAELEGRLIELAGQAGVRKIVKSSAFAAGLQPPVGYGINHALAEKQLQDSNLDWVILRPYMFMQNFLELAGVVRWPGLLPLPLGKAEIALIDARDVALAAFHALTRTDCHKAIYTLTGPESLSIAGCAERFSRSLGQAVRYVSPPFWFAGLLMRLQGVSAWDLGMRKALFGMIAAGGEAGISADFEKLTGTKPRTLDIFIRDHLPVFAGSKTGR